MMKLFEHLDSFDDFYSYKESIEDIFRNNSLLFMRILKSKAIRKYYQDNKKDNPNVNYEKLLEKYFSDSIVYDQIVKYIILMPFPPRLNGITTNFLRIAINITGIQFSCCSNNNKNLLTAYCLMILLKEANNFVNRFCNINKPEKERLKLIEGDRDLDYCNGEWKRRRKNIISTLFRDRFENQITIKQAEKISNEETWENPDGFDRLFKHPRGNYIQFNGPKIRKPCCVTNYDSD